MEEEGQDTGALVMDLAPVYSLGPAWPPLEMTALDEEDIIERLKAYLEKRLVTRRALLEDHENKEMKFMDLLLHSKRACFSGNFSVLNSAVVLFRGMFPHAVRHAVLVFYLTITKE